MTNVTRLRKAHPPGASRSKRRSSRRRGSGASAVARNLVMVWVALFSLVSVVVLGFAVYLWLRRSSADQQKVVERQEFERRVVSRFPSPSEEEALALVKGSLAIGSEQDVFRYFRAPGRSAAEVLAFVREYGKRGAADAAAVRYTWLSSIDANGLLLDGVGISPPGGEEMKRLALLTPDEKGVWRIDFDAFARVCEPPLETLLEQEEGSGVVRVMIVPDTLYLGPFADEAKWMSFALGSPDREEPLRAYCLRGSVVERALHGILAAAAGPRGGSPRAVLGIVRRGKAVDPLFEITAVYADDWVMGPQRFDRKFE
jgi:hypothetical protein